MSTPATASGATPSGTPHAAQAAQTAGGRPGARKPGAQDAPDIFTQLLSLLSASADAPLAINPGGADPATDASAVDPEDPAARGEAALAALMQWADLPQSGAARSAAGAGDATSAVLPGGADKALPGLATAAAPGAAGATDALPPGLQRLDRPEAADAQTLAALSDATAGATAETPPSDPAAVTDALPQAPAAATAHRPAAAGRHATAPSGMASTQALQQAPHAGAAGERPTVRVETSAAAPLRSTVMLDERFAASVAARPAVADDSPGADPALPLAATVPAGAVAAAAPGGEPAGTPNGDTGTGPDGGGPNHDLSDDSTEPAPETYADARADAEERLDSCTSASLQEATLRVGESDAEAIDIRLSLHGQALDLGFRTDDAEARAALARHAQGNLSELLQRSGLQLGDVSVGPQGGQAGRGEGQGGRPSGATRPVGPRGGDSVAEAGAPVPPRPRSDGNRPLDLFV